MFITLLYLVFVFVGAAGFALLAAMAACLVAGFLYLSAFFLNLRDELRLARMNRHASPASRH